MPVPSEVEPKLLDNVGVWLVLQTTPRAVTFAPPLLVIFPPETALVNVMDEAAVVDSVPVAQLPKVAVENSTPWILTF